MYFCETYLVKRQEGIFSEQKEVTLWAEHAPQKVYGMSRPPGPIRPLPGGKAEVTSHCKKCVKWVLN